MAKEPVFSFVVPVYKKPPEVLEKCLAHLQDMSFRDIEIICVFDGEDEKLQKVAEGFKKVQIHVIEHGGAPKARNAGLDLARGRYVVFWDCDSYAKPEMAKRWLEEFEAVPKADFVYSGYEFTEERGGYPSEPFDAYSLQCGNYISSMFPIKREKCPRWDESLSGAQDWDFWLTAVENGCHGKFIEGFGFSTEPSYGGSISAKAWSPEKREETIRIIKEKHGIPKREIATCSFRHFLKALHIAKQVNADILKDTAASMANYKMIFNLGFGEYIRFKGATPDSVKIQYWMPWDIDCLYAIAFKTARDTIRNANKEITFNWCNEIASQKRLEDLGIKAEVVPLPTEIDDLETKLPEKFKVLIDADKAHLPVLTDIPRALPHIPIDFISDMGNMAPITDYSLILSFWENPTIDEGVRRFLLHGRHVISNIQAPFCGYIDMQTIHKDFKNEMINRILDARVAPFNQKAKDYYVNLVDPKKFTEKLFGVMPKKELEVVNA